jgi:hypothetical protein
VPDALAEAEHLPPAVEGVEERNVHASSGARCTRRGSNIAARIAIGACIRMVHRWGSRQQTSSTRVLTCVVLMLVAVAAEQTHPLLARLRLQAITQ